MAIILPELIFDPKNPNDEKSAEEENTETDAIPTSESKPKEIKKHDSIVRSKFSQSQKTVVISGVRDKHKGSGEEKSL